MNKATITLFLILAALAITVSADQCCYIEAIGLCTEQYDALDCDVYTGNYFSKSCNEVSECDYVCCCYGDDYEYIRRGICENVKQGTAFDKQEALCAETLGCGGTIASCNDNCILNPSTCIGQSGIVPGNKYYCWINEQYYDDFATCNSLCQEIEFIPDCAEGAWIPAGERCYCGGEVHDNGYCCWDNTWRLNPNEDPCPPENDCIVHQEAGDYFECCDACAGNEPSYPDGDFACFSSDPAQPQCCRECAAMYTDCCEWSWQCPDILSDLYATCPTVPCGEECLRPQCRPNEKIGINPEQRCWCNGIPYDPADTIDKEKWCCADGARNAPCSGEYFNLEGYVYDIRSPSTHVPGAEVKITPDLKAMTDSAGEYRINYIPLHISYTITITHPNYYPNIIDFEAINEKPPGEGTLTKNYPMTPLVEDECDSSHPPGASDFRAEHIKGVEAVRLRWSNPCADHTGKVDHYELFRVPAFASGPKQIQSSPALLNLELIDDNVSWQSSYEYIIRVHYGEPGKPGYISENTSATIALGHPYCEDITQTNDHEFCLDSDLEKSDLPVLRYRCTGNNEIIPASTGGVNSDCRTYDTDQITNRCIGPDPDGRTDCARMDLSKNCTPDFRNPFGLFFTAFVVKDNWEACEAQNLFCYYDYSDTTVDTCYDCNAVSSCYDYRSEEACLKDNCKAGGKITSGTNNGCQWKPTPYSETGKGICYDADNRGGDYCGLCSNLNIHIFQNALCTQQICDVLGACYLNGDSCFSCVYDEQPIAQRTRCEDFLTENTCIKSDSFNKQPVEIDSTCPVSVNFSNDACDLGYCRWDGSTCNKDANQDGIADCSHISNPDARHECQADFKPAETMPTTEIPMLNKQGREITFRVNNGEALYTGDQLSSFRFCLDKEDLCCPDQEMEISLDGMSTTFNPMDTAAADSVDEASVYYLRYFTEDKYDNIEQIKSIAVYIDRIKPNITLNYYTQPEGRYNYTTFELFSMNEIIQCSYDMFPEVESARIVKDNFGSSFNTSFAVKFRNLEDGNYVMKINCSDVVGNEVNITAELMVDLDHNAVAQFPNMHILNEDHISFYLTTYDNSSCMLTSVSDTEDLPYKLFEGSIQMNQKKKITPAGASYNHTAGPIFISAERRNVSYLVKTICTRLNGGNDYAFYHFTLDDEPPETATDFEFWTPSSPVKHKFDSGLDHVSVPLECNDKHIAGVPGISGQGGCAETYIFKSTLPGQCLTYGSCNFQPTSQSADSIVFAQSGYLYYYSVDPQGNKERIRSGRVIIDNTAPTVSIEPLVPSQTRKHPTEGYMVQVTNIRYHTIKGEATADTDKVQVTINGLDVGYSISEIADRYGSEDRYYKLENVALYDGTNVIRADANDTAGNLGQAVASVYLDRNPPTVISAQIFDNFDRDSDGNIIDQDEEEHLEYNKNLTFRIQLADDMIGVDNETVHVSLYHKDGSLYNKYKLSNTSRQNYQFILQAPLPLGLYVVNFTAEDEYSNKVQHIITINMNDTQRPVINIVNPPITASFMHTPETVYSSQISVIGETDPAINLEISSWDETGFTQHDLQTTMSSPDESVELDTFILAALPQKRDTVLYVQGHLASEIYGKYLELTIDGVREQEYPRFRVLDAVNANMGCPFGNDCTITVIDKEFPQQASSLVRVHIFTTAYPTGYFRKTIALGDQLNVIKVATTDVNGLTSQAYRYVYYDSSVDLGINILEPSHISSIDGTTRLVNKQDFEDNGNKIIIEVETENFASDCEIIHSDEDNIAPRFKDDMVSSAGGTHTYEVDADDCKENSGNYCLVGGNAVYHYYHINCTARDYPELYSSLSLCFKVDIVNDQTEGNLCTEQSKDYCRGNPDADPCTGQDQCDDNACNPAIDCGCLYYGDCSEQDCIVEDYCSDGECNNEQDCNCLGYGDCTEQDCEGFETII